MARWLVWTCGGVAAVGVLALLCVAAATHTEDQARTVPARPAPSTPASTSREDALVRFEAQLQQNMMKDGRLVPPGPGASPSEVKAYTYVMESKAGGRDDLQAIRETALRIMEEKEKEHAIRRAEQKRANQERRDSERQKNLEKRPAVPPDVAARFQAMPRPTAPDLQPALEEDPENPLPKNSSKK